MIDVGDEAAAGRYLGRHGFEIDLGKGEGCSAHLADEVLVVGFVGEVVDGWSVTQVAVPDQICLLQGFQRSVHRRAIKVGSGLCARLVVDVVGGEVLPVRRRQHLAYCPAGVCDPEALDTQCGNEVVRADVHDGQGIAILATVNRRSPPLDPHAN